MDGGILGTEGKFFWTYLQDVFKEQNYFSQYCKVCECH